MILAITSMKMSEVFLVRLMDKVLFSYPSNYNAYNIMTWFDLSFLRKAEMDINGTSANAEIKIQTLFNSST